MIKIGSKIRIRLDNDNENYKRWRNKTLTVEKISRNKKDHPGYDEAIGGMLVDCKNFPFSLYEYEFVEV